MEFELNQVLRIKRTGHIGDCTGRCEYSYDSPAFRLSYTDAQGNAQSGWFNSAELEAVTPVNL